MSKKESIVNYRSRFDLMDKRTNKVLLHDATVEEVVKVNGLHKGTIYNAKPNIPKNVYNKWVILKHLMPKKEKPLYKDVPARRIDKGKARALHNAGWSDSEIAYEFSTNEKIVQEVLAKALEM